MSSFFKRDISNGSNPKSSNALETFFYLSSNSALGMSVETLWHNSFLKHLILTMFASRLVSLSPGMSCHPVEGADKLQISRSNKCKSVMSNALETGGSPEEGNSFSQWLWNNTPLEFRP